MPRGDCGGSSGGGGWQRWRSGQKLYRKHFTSRASLGTAAAPTPSATGTATHPEVRMATSARFSSETPSLGHVDDNPRRYLCICQVRSGRGTDATAAYRAPASRRGPLRVGADLTIVLRTALHSCLLARTSAGRDGRHSGPSGACLAH